MSREFPAIEPGVFSAKGLTCVPFDKDHKGSICAGCVFDKEPEKTGCMSHDCSYVVWVTRTQYAKYKLIGKEAIWPHLSTSSSCSPEHGTGPSP